METVIMIFGEGKELSILQMSCRSAVVFILALIMIRIAGRRTFGLGKAIDNIIVILLGSVLARAVAGAAPFLPTVAACLVFAVLHRVCALISIYYRPFSRLANGERRLLYENGSYHKLNLRKALVHEEDVLEQVRLKTNRNSMEHIETVYMEKNGEMSAIVKEHKP